ncbi:DUF6542 domain-containing protein [Streptantibioticus ferralitis]|uniref:DUF6542 domain-containing protein n=1 Tax=Streptantibioticus ferralitis TaxID=236510 RepID=A0ABT5YXD3_9ACTN|nr:DUF6542 domain-containing protein [Streptantibioticus ferralitis]MDF2256143.1 hypothetical protein [Streptantibioticus ferralitis]
MAGRPADALGENAERWQNQNGSGAEPLSARRVPQQAATRTASRSRSGRVAGSAARVRAARGAAIRARRGERQPARARGVALLLALPVMGAALDEAVSSQLGWAFLLMAVAAAAVAAASCSRSALWWLVPAPPLVVAAVTVTAELLLGPAAFQGGKGLTTGAVRWGVDAFPAMAAAEAAVLAVLLVRYARARLGGRAGSA